MFETKKILWVDKLKEQIPPSLFGRYVMVGTGNTLFSYGSYAGLTAVLTPHLPHAYIVAAIVSNLLSITFSFLNYKWFIFKTKGKYIKEWLRCLVVYGGGSLFGVALLPVIVFTIRRLTSLYVSAPYIAGALIAGATVLLSFVGHKNFTFKTSADTE